MEKTGEKTPPIIITSIKWEQAELGGVPPSGPAERWRPWQPDLLTFYRTFLPVIIKSTGVVSGGGWGLMKQSTSSSSISSPYGLDVFECGRRVPNKPFRNKGPAVASQGSEMVKWTWRDLWQAHPRSPAELLHSHPSSAFAAVQINCRLN